MKKIKPFKFEKLEYPQAVACDSCGNVTRWITAVWPLKPKNAGVPPTKRLCTQCADGQYEL